MQLGQQVQIPGSQGQSETQVWQWKFPESFSTFTLLCFYQHGTKTDQAELGGNRKDGPIDQGAGGLNDLAETKTKMAKDI